MWVYWAGGAVGDELLWSTQLAIAHLRGVKNFAICGDVPDWWEGHGIDSPKWTHAAHHNKFGTSAWTKWIDSIIKLQRIIDDPAISEDFLWMYDDTFITREITIAELAQPRVQGQLNQNASGNLWRQCRGRTAQALLAHGMTIHNYSTHMPMVFNKRKLQETIDLFDCHNSPRVIESLYGNHHLGQPSGLGGIFHYRRRPTSGWMPPPSAAVVNVGQFSAVVQQALSALLPRHCTEVSCYAS